MHHTQSKPAKRVGGAHPTHQAAQGTVKTPKIQQMSQKDAERSGPHVHRLTKGLVPISLIRLLRLVKGCGFRQHWRWHEDKEPLMRNTFRKETKHPQHNLSGVTEIPLPKPY